MIGFQHEVDNEHFYQIAISDFQNFENSGYLGKNQQNITFKKLLSCQKQNISGKLCLMYMCTYVRVDISKNGRVLVF